MDGFTLIELLIVIIIIGILAGISIPLVLQARRRGYDTQSKSDLRNFATLQETYFADNRRYGGYTPVAAVGPFDHTSSFAVVGASASGFCLAASTAPSTAWFLFDSSAGGLQSVGYTTQADASAGCWHGRRRADLGVAGMVRLRHLRQD